VHYDEVVKVEQVKRRQTKNRGQRSFVKTVARNESVFGIDCAQTQVHGYYQAAEEQHRLGEQ
jgi:ribosomal protein S20